VSSTSPPTASTATSPPVAVTRWPSTQGKSPTTQVAIDHGALYDTTAFGHANTGHTFGDRLSPDERRAIIEFLKSLSGPDM
jgi:hypothetical protein